MTMTQPGLPSRGQLSTSHDQPPKGLTVEDLWYEIVRLREDLNLHRATPHVYRAERER